MIVAGLEESLQCVFKASVLKRFLKALDAPWQDFYWDGQFCFQLATGAQVPVVQYRLIIDNISEQSREISGLHEANCHSKVCAVWRTQVFRWCVWM